MQLAPPLRSLIVQNQTETHKPMYLVDSHCHINFPQLQARLDEVLANARENDVQHMLCISTTWENFFEVRELANKHSEISASIGIHPCTTEGHEPDLDELLTHGKDDLIVAVGETGLDYHWHEGDLEWQHQRFHRHIEAAIELQKPLIIHTRAAADDTMQTLRDHQARDAGGVMHCFAENWDIAKQALDIGFYISFSGIVTFKSAPEIQEVARKAPIDRILVETDSPYLAPVPKRGKPNEPAYVRHTAEFVAAQRGMTIEELAQVTTDNFYTLFPLAKKN